ncbi:cobalamin biosynthesis protein CbiM [Haloferax mucosum ATCC BAA-1512]|uniref:Cobalamin biosynthesis protein CbiM n=2 Tax=Haloferax mucosum TaxID=403181 RepID=M0IEK5_9EURY|nr:cobalamin biosynthesis protein CbiM [Haloferax mucosum ATCC BAA-1512]
MAALFIIASIGVLAFGTRKIRGTVTPRQTQLFGMVTASIFAAQMLNWPLPGGVSAHFVGGALAAIVLGPHLGALSVALVVAVQALVFGDGGVLALGANVWNMAIVQVYGGYAVYRVVSEYNETGAIVLAGWASITLAALSAGIQLGLSPAFGSELISVVTVMAGGHAVLGVGEALLTLLGVHLVARFDAADAESVEGGVVA